MRIAVVDSGIDPGHRRLAGAHVSGVALRLSGDGAVAVSDDYVDTLGHGTACAAIIHRLVPDAELVAVRIFHDHLAASEAVLCAALRWCVDHDVPLVNLSLGVRTNDPSESLSRVCEEAYRRGIVVVSAAHNTLNEECYPAHFPTVLGVAAGKVPHRCSFGYLPDSPIEFVAKGVLQRLAWRAGGFTISNGSSFACAYFTGIAAQYLARLDGQQPRVEVLKRLLIEDADERVQSFQYLRSASASVPVIWKEDLDALGSTLFCSSRRLDWIGRLALFPIGEKELDAFFHFQHLAPFEVTKWLTYPRSIRQAPTNAGATVADVEDTMPADDAFDTLVVGYFHTHLFEANLRFGSDLLRHAVAHQKNIFAFDRHVRRLLADDRATGRYAGMLYVPEVQAETMTQVMSFRHLPEVSVPVLSVIGTSNRQGKFTTQLRLKGVLEGEGYRVAHVTTEPHGELLGAACCFPYGHNGTVYIDRTQWASYVRVLLRGVERYNAPHLILTGTQSGLLPRSSRILPRGTEMDSLTYVLGAQSDAFVCAINPEDPVEMIRRTTEAARWLSDGAPTILYVMNPWQRSFRRTADGRTIRDYRLLDADAFAERAAYFAAILDAPVIDILDSSHDDLLVSTVESAFS